MMMDAQKVRLARIFLTYLRGRYKEERPYKALSKEKRLEVDQLVDLLNSERKQTRNKSYSYLENQNALVTARILYLDSIREYNKLKRENSKNKKVADALKEMIREVVREELKGETNE